MEYDEQEAIKYIKQVCSCDISSNEILDIIDSIWDYYEEKGFLDISFDVPLGVVVGDFGLIKNVKNKMKEIYIDESIVEQIIQAELDYEKTLDEF